MLIPFLFALAASAFCGLSILVITVIDIRNNRRGKALRPVRAFDIVFGLMLAGPGLAGFSALMR